LVASRTAPLLSWCNRHRPVALARWQAFIFSVPVRFGQASLFPHSPRPGSGCRLHPVHPAAISRTPGSRSCWCVPCG